MPAKSAVDAMRLVFAVLAMGLVACSPEGAAGTANSAPAPPLAAAPSATDRSITGDTEYAAVIARLGGEDLFRSKLIRFLGPLRGPYILRGNQLVYDHVGEALSGAPVRLEALAEGGYLVWNCRPHSCLERGAVVFSSDGAMVAAGLIYSRCGKGCIGQPRLAVFRRQAGSAAALQRWADRQKGDYDEVFGPTETVILD